MRAAQCRAARRQLGGAHSGEGAPRVVAELTRDEGEEQALPVLHGDGAYLERARTGESGLCRALADDEALARPARRKAA